MSNFFELAKGFTLGNNEAYDMQLWGKEDGVLKGEAKLSADGKTYVVTASNGLGVPVGTTLSAAYGTEGA